MKNSLSHASALLELTRDAYDPPDAAARERVRKRIAAALVGTVAGAHASAAEAASANKLQAVAQSKSAASVNLFAKLALVTSMTMMGGAAWLVLPHGDHAGRTQVTWMRMTEAPEVRAPVLPVMRVESLRERTEAEEKGAPPSAPSAESARPSSTPSSTPAPDREASAMQAEASPPPAVTARTHTSRARRSSSMSEEESLAAEVSLLHNAERALASGDPELALSMLQTHREQFPRALLREEQAGLVALARCTVDADDARPARSFLARHPDSMLNARIRQACPLAAQ